MSIDHAREILANNNVRSGMLVGDIEWPSDYNADFYILRDDSECLAILSRKIDGGISHLIAMYVPNLVTSKGHDIHMMLSWIEWDSDGCYIIKFPRYKVQKCERANQEGKWSP